MKGITALYRHIDINADKTKPPGIANNGGGTTTKRFHLQRALPDLEIINDIEDAGLISIAEILWFSEGGHDMMRSRIDRWSKLRAFKILMTSDVELLRMHGEHRDQLIENSDVVACLTEYVLQLFKAFTDKAMLLHDPIDIDMFKPLKKKREIVGVGQVSTEKRVQSIIDIFHRLPDTLELEKTYIGSKNLWAGNSSPALSAKLEQALFEVCDQLEPKVPYTEMPKKLGSAWGYVADTGYDFSSYSMTEAMACGCYLFTGRHLMYNERPGRRFKTSEEAVEGITTQLQETPPASGVINEEARQYVIDRCSYDAFRAQLKKVVGDANIGI